jgi:hypothetical protein
MRSSGIGQDIPGLVYSDYLGYNGDAQIYFNKRVEHRIADNQPSEKPLVGSTDIYKEEIYLEKLPNGGFIVKERRVSRPIKVDQVKQDNPKNEKDDSIDFKFPKYTLKDLEVYGYANSLRDGYDKRTFSEFISDYYVHYHQFLSIFLKTSLVLPTWMRINFFLLFLNILCCLNALLFSDEDIDRRVRQPENIRVNSFNLGKF